MIEHLILKNSYNGYYFETATERKAEHYTKKADSIRESA